MEIETKGRPSNVSLALCKRAVRAFGEKLLGPRLSPHVTVYVHFSKELEDTDFCGFCENLECGPRPREFYIMLKPSLKKRTMLLTIAHEISHVRQYARNEFQEIDLNRSRWKGEVFNKKDYYFLPWEIEARGMELALYYYFIDLEKNTR